MFRLCTYRVPSQRTRALARRRRRSQQRHRLPTARHKSRASAASQAWRRSFPGILSYLGLPRAAVPRGCTGRCVEAVSPPRRPPVANPPVEGVSRWLPERLPPVGSGGLCFPSYPILAGSRISTSCRSKQPCKQPRRSRAPCPPPSSRAPANPLEAVASRRADEPPRLCLPLRFFSHESASPVILLHLSALELFLREPSLSRLGPSPLSPSVPPASEATY